MIAIYFVVKLACRFSCILRNSAAKFCCHIGDILVTPLDSF
jgi:hypothetical protein